MIKQYADFTDDVNGVIVGGNYGMAWLTYEGRRQGSTCYPSCEVEAISLCEAIKGSINKECGQAFDLIYPNPNGWKIHMDGI